MVEPGYEGIKVHMVGSDRGVDYEHPIVTGRVFYNPVTYNIYKFPTFVQRVIWRAPEIVDGEADGSADESNHLPELGGVPVQRRRGIRLPVHSGADAGPVREVPPRRRPESRWGRSATACGRRSWRSGRTWRACRFSVTA